MPDLGKQIQGRILGPSGTDVLSQGMKDLYHFLLREEKDKPKAPYGGVPSLSQMPRMQERSALDIGRSYWTNLSQEEKLMEFVDLLAPGPAKLGAGVKGVLGAAKGVPLVGAILRKDALKSLGRGFRKLTRIYRSIDAGIAAEARAVGKPIPPMEPEPSNQIIKELIQGIRKTPQSELDFVDEINLTMSKGLFGSFTPAEKLIPYQKVPSRVKLSVNPRLPFGEGINTVLHELGHARVAGASKTRPSRQFEEQIVRRYSDAITPFAEQAVKEGKKLNPGVVNKMLTAATIDVGAPAKIAELQRSGITEGIGALTENLAKARRTLRGQLPGEMRMFLEESSKKLSGEQIAKKIGGIRYEGVMEGIPEAGIPNVYQFTALGGSSKGGTFSAGSLDLEDVKKALGKQKDTWRRAAGGEAGKEARRTMANSLPGVRRFYRGTIPGEPKRIEEVFGAGKGKTWVAKNPESARLYGERIEEIHARSGAKILDEQTAEFGKVVGIRGYKQDLRLINQPGLKGRLIDHVDMAINKARAAGYDAVSFSSDSDIGTVILNESAFQRNIKKTSGLRKLLEDFGD